MPIPYCFNQFINLFALRGQRRARKNKIIKKEKSTTSPMAQCQRGSIAAILLEKKKVFIDRRINLL